MSISRVKNESMTFTCPALTLVWRANHPTLLEVKKQDAAGLIPSDDLVAFLIEVENAKRRALCPDHVRPIDR